jgi:hypothetical protein
MLLLAQENLNHLAKGKKQRWNNPLSAIFHRNLRSPWFEPGGTAPLAVGWPIG